MNQPEPSPMQVKAGTGCYWGRYWVTACLRAQCDRGDHLDPLEAECPPAAAA